MKVANSLFTFLNNPGRGFRASMQLIPLLAIVLTLTAVLRYSRPTILRTRSAEQSMFQGLDLHPEGRLISMPEIPRAILIPGISTKHTLHPAEMLQLILAMFGRWEILKCRTVCLAAYMARMPAR